MILNIDWHRGSHRLCPELEMTCIQSYEYPHNHGLPNKVTEVHHLKKKKKKPTKGFGVTKTRRVKYSKIKSLTFKGLNVCFPGINAASLA